MIDFHCVATPNGNKVSVMLEETGLPYDVIPYDIFQGDQLSPEFRKLNPNRKLPVITDHEPIGGGGAPITVFESGAILIYLAEKTGRFLPRQPCNRYATLQWVMWQMAGLGPMHGQAHHFVRYAPADSANDYARNRYLREAERLLRVMEMQLSDTEYLAGDYSIADIACWPWIRGVPLIDLTLERYPNLERWYSAVEARPAVKVGSTIISDFIKRIGTSDTVPLTDEQWSVLFGERQHAEQ